MQQTNKYELNKPDLDDPVAIAPLNENMDKLEAALIAEAKSRADADAAESSARTAAIQAEASARASADTTETNARVAAIKSEATARANADTTETNARVAADKAEAKSRADADTAEATARTSADNALSSRIQALEAKRIATGSYTVPGSGAEFKVTLPFTPYLVLANTCSNSYSAMALPSQASYGVRIVTNGFMVDPEYYHMVGPNNYIALG